jgi:hypothetical protein
VADSHAIPGAAGRWLDRLGISASMVCAAHCVALTAAVAVWPALWLRQNIAGVQVRWLLWLEFALAATSMLAALAALAAGYSRHRRLLPSLLLLPGMLTLGFGVFSRVHFVPWWGTVVVLCGGVLLVVGHWLNLRLR